MASTALPTKSIVTYWDSYGGWRAIWQSRYFRWSLFFTVLLFPAWLGAAWWSISLQVLPNVVGFSIGGFAAWLAFGEEQFQALLAEQDQDDDVTDYILLSATFTHFVIVQVGAVMFAVLGWALLDPEVPLSVASRMEDIWPEGLAVFRGSLGFMGFFLFVYAMSTAIALVGVIFRIARLYVAYQQMKREFGKKARASDPAPDHAAPNRPRTRADHN